MRKYNLNSENHVIKWLNHIEGYGNSREYHDSFIPDSFHKPPKKITEQDKYRNSKRFKAMQRMREEAGKCSICSSTKNLVIDHCHTSKKVRGVICDLCNKGLGDFRDNVEFMKKAIEYLDTARKNEKDAQYYFKLK